MPEGLFLLLIAISIYYVIGRFTVKIEKLHQLYTTGKYSYKNDVDVIIWIWPFIWSVVVFYYIVITPITLISEKLDNIALNSYKKKKDALIINEEVT